MIEDAVINLKNTYQAAMAMVNIDASLIKPNHTKYSHFFMNDLKKAMDEYEKPFTMNDQIAPLDKYLSDLLKATQNIYNILGDEGKNFVVNYLKG